MSSLVKLANKFKYNLTHFTLIGIYLLALKFVTPTNVIAIIILILGLVSISLGIMDANKVAKAIR